MYLMVLTILGNGATSRPLFTRCCICAPIQFTPANLIRLPMLSTMCRPSDRNGNCMSSRIDICGRRVGNRTQDCSAGAPMPFWSSLVVPFKTWHVSISSSCPLTPRHHVLLWSSWTCICNVAGFHLQIGAVASQRPKCRSLCRHMSSPQGARSRVTPANRRCPPLLAVSMVQFHSAPMCVTQSVNVTARFFASRHFVILALLAMVTKLLFAMQGATPSNKNNHRITKAMEGTLAPCTNK
mmetsp:Transcript_98380/g.195042  ORF Transcript_98380/g.195042 Transcript_98380/m.195042 type:complete len:239 (-) Transcript_98380:24-740(-)